MRLRYQGPSHVFQYAEHRFERGGASVDVPDDHAMELLTYPEHRFEQVAGEDAAPPPQAVFSVETAPAPGPQPIQPPVSIDAAPFVPQPEPPAAPQA
jgi:hypothetical protein